MRGDNVYVPPEYANKKKWTDAVNQAEITRWKRHTTKRPIVRINLVRGTQAECVPRYWKVNWSLCGKWTDLCSRKKYSSPSIYVWWDFFYIHFYSVWSFSYVSTLSERWAELIMLITLKRWEGTPGNPEIYLRVFRLTLMLEIPKVYTCICTKYIVYWRIPNYAVNGFLRRVNEKH